MLSTSRTNLRRGTIDQPVESWLKRLFYKTPPREKDLAQDYERRDSFRLDLNEAQPLDASITLADGTVCSTIFLDLSASGFSCEVPKVLRLKSEDVVSVLFVLPMKDPVPMRAEARPVYPPDSDPTASRRLRFKFSEDMDEEDRETIHRFVLDKQFEWIQKRQG